MLVLTLLFHYQFFKAINLVYEVLSALDGDEVQNFLPVFSEVIIWGATDEGLDSLIDKMTNKEWKSVLNQFTLPVTNTPI